MSAALGDEEDVIVIRTTSSARRAIRCPCRRHPGDVSIGSDQNSSGGCHVTQDRKLPIAAIFGLDRQHSVCPRGGITSPGLVEVQQDRLGVVEQSEYSHRAIGGDEVQIGHTAPEQRVPSPRS